MSDVTARKNRVCARLPTLASLVVLLTFASPIRAQTCLGVPALAVRTIDVHTAAFEVTEYVSAGATSRWMSRMGQRLGVRYTTASPTGHLGLEVVGTNVPRSDGGARSAQLVLDWDVPHPAACLSAGFIAFGSRISDREPAGSSFGGALSGGVGVHFDRRVVRTVQPYVIVRTLLGLEVDRGCSCEDLFFAGSGDLGLIFDLRSFFFTFDAGLDYPPMLGGGPDDLTPRVGLRIGKSFPPD